MVGLSTKAFALALKTFTTKTTAEIAAICDISESAVNQIYELLCERGFDPHARPIVVKDSFLEDARCAPRRICYNYPANPKEGESSED
ncbi:hypothetical protein PEBR_12219 [Penicillium brasilianum]|uniref:Uncharacterized protein n=1 Tax=Penicillium brasilianum TaxID=104259 RepID=A0A1S9RSI4_PENBI|nr:hypothetical protein PEBR_12219 [Penicillium brasilianum]